MQSVEEKLKDYEAKHKLCSDMNDDAGRQFWAGAVYALKKIMHELVKDETEPEPNAARAKLIEIIGCAEELGKTGKMAPMYFNAADIEEMRVAAGIDTANKKNRGGCHEESK